jgi:glycosyltransferase involved in cell wall biosynthesis
LTPSLHGETFRRLSVCVCGTFDPEFHRNRMVVRLLAKTGCELDVRHVPLWGKREDTVVRRSKARLAGRAILAMPRLVRRFGSAPAPDVLLVLYPGQLDVPFLAWSARRRGVPILFDPFISLHDTVVQDRRLVPERSLLARFLRGLDRQACRLSTTVLADTPADADYFAKLADMDPRRFRVLWVGAEEDVFRPQAVRPTVGRVLFYGTFIPLHGCDTIVRAAKLLERHDVSFRLIGQGQEIAAVRRLAGDLASTNLEIVPPVPLAELPREIATASVCLGIFGTSDKAARVVPNKVFQCVAVGRSVITADTPAIRSAFVPGEEVVTVAAGDPAALASAIGDLLAAPERRERLAQAARARFDRDYSEDVQAVRLRAILDATVGQRPGGARKRPLALV